MKLFVLSSVHVKSGETSLIVDPLSDVLSILKPESHLAALLISGGDWSIRFPDQKGALKCNAVIEGEAWVVVDDDHDPVKVCRGDFFLLPSGRPFVLTSDPELPSVSAHHFFDQANPGDVVQLNEGTDTVIASSRFTLLNQNAAQLLSVLPTVVVVPAEAPDAERLKWFVELVVSELQTPRAGSVLTTAHLSHLILVQTLRSYLSTQDGQLGWLSALADPRLSIALKAMHANPERKWTLAALADCSGMSRAVFARRFREVVGQTPMEYLSCWRMLKASNQLISTHDSISTVAMGVGYISESAFNTAFKRIMGLPPRRYIQEFGSQGFSADASVQFADNSGYRIP